MKRRRGSSLSDSGDTKKSAPGKGKGKRQRSVKQHEEGEEDGEVPTTGNAVKEHELTKASTSGDTIAKHDNMNDEMERLLGFSSFDSTQGKAVDDNHVGAARGHAKINQKREYRQYLNKNPSKNKRG